MVVTSSFRSVTPFFLLVTGGQVVFRLLQSETPHGAGPPAIRDCICVSSSVINTHILSANKTYLFACVQFGSRVYDLKLPNTSCLEEVQAWMSDICVGLNVRAYACCSLYCRRWPGFPPAFRIFAIALSFFFASFFVLTQLPAHDPSGGKHCGVANRDHPRGSVQIS